MQQVVIEDEEKLNLVEVPDDEDIFFEEDMKTVKSGTKANFVLSLQTWRGPTHVRTGPSTEIYRIVIYEGSKIFYILKFDYDPTSNTFVAIDDTYDNLLIDFKKGGSVNIPPNSKLNTTKDTPSVLSYLDKGKCMILDDTNNEKSFQFFGERLIGEYKMTKKENESAWNWVFEVDNEKSVASYSIIKKNDEKRLIYGLVLVPDKVDLQDEFIESDDIEKAAHDYLIRSRNIDVMHFQNRPCYVVESFLAPVDFVMENKKITKGSWVMVVYVPDDEIWNEVKKGELRGFSIFGTATLEEEGNNNGS